jgi:wyosine [tRNA(Phe)-imidazoG37] synthetase (radical SAM superfamily)
MNHPSRVPYMVFADENGQIFEDTRYEVVGRSGYNVYPLQPEDFIELPYGSDLFTLPGRRPYGLDVETGEFEILEDVQAVAALNAPAYTQLYMAAFGTDDENAPTLPLYCYTAVGWLDDKFYTAAVRIDPDIRQDLEHFDQDHIVKVTDQVIAAHPGNRLIEHLGNNCSKRYCCPAARNFFLGRWECPIPVSPACNSNCLGCISFQPEEHELTSPQDRLTFIPSVDEIVEFTVPHLERAERPIVSFGQGCEGEPLLVWQLIRDAIKRIRQKTSKGIININTNGSKPAAVEELMKAGLNSIRVSTNSARKAIYEAYYLPNNYSFEDIRESSRIVRQYGGWASINYFTFPGMTDQQEEYEALRDWIRFADLSMIQWRNFNIDPDWYLGKLNITELSEGMGIREVMALVKKEFPHLAYGYFNPPQQVQQQYNELRISLSGASS